MAKIKLEDSIKIDIANVFKNRITKIGLSPTSVLQPSDTSQNYATVLNDLCGDTGLLDIQPDGTTTFKIKNNLTNKPLLVFTVAYAEQPKKYILYRVSGSDYFRECMIDTTQSGATYDTAVLLRSLEIEFKGDGE